MFAEIASPNPRLSSLKRVIRQVFSALFKEHVGKKLDELTNLRRAQEKLMTPEVIQVAEAQAFDDIWVVSHTLHTELHDKDMIPSILENLLEKGIHYTFFVPNSDLAKRAIEKIHKEFQEKSKNENSVTHREVNMQAVLDSEVIQMGSGQYQFIFLQQGVFMPFDELVIYDGENPSASWGYIQMRYESSEDTPLTLRVPQRSLNLVSNFLLDYKKESLEITPSD